MRKTIPPLPTSGGGAMLVPACLWALLLAGMLATCVLVGAWSEPAKAAFPGTNGRIAFEGYRVFEVSPGGQTTEAPEIITVRPDGTGMKQLTQASGSSDPDFSPDGTKIAYSGSPSTVEIYEDIYVMARSGKGKKALTDTDDRNEWGPQRVGSRLLPGRHQDRVLEGAAVHPPRREHRIAARHLGDES